MLCEETLTFSLSHISSLRFQMTPLARIDDATPLRIFMILHIHVEKNLFTHLVNIDSKIIPLVEIAHENNMNLNLNYQLAKTL